MKARLLVSIVTFQSAADLPRCLDSLRRQTFREFLVAVWDNASIDGTRRVLSERGGELAETVLSDVNMGYGAGHNRMMARHESEYALFLNPDTVMADDCLERAVAALDAHPECGSLSPKILRLDAAIPGAAEPRRPGSAAR
jgi:GT2 family glycosyltransferase